MHKVLDKMNSRSGKNPKRRIVASACLDADAREQLAARVQYVGSGHHKRNPADYDMDRTNPRPTKSLCDLVKVVTIDEARRLLREGVRRAMISQPGNDGIPKYVWSVADDGEVYEAKTHPNTSGQYHGYPLVGEDDLRSYVTRVWVERCKELGK